MFSTVFNQNSTSPSVANRPPMSNENIDYNSQRVPNRRSLSDRLRNLFRKNSSSPSRSVSNDRRSAVKSVRQSSPSPEVAGLHTPKVHFPFSKKKTKVPEPISKSAINKKKTKDNRKAKQTSTAPMEISNPIYVQENRTAIHGQNFVPRTPEFIHGSYEEMQTSSTYDAKITNGIRNYAMIGETQQYQQVVVPDAHTFIPSTYTSNSSPSLSMNRQQFPNSNIDYRYKSDTSMPTAKIPLADVELIDTPQRKRKAGDTSPLTNNQRLIEKPPIFPQTSLRSPAAIQVTNAIANPSESTRVTSFMSNNTEMRPTTLTPKDKDVTKLHTPMVTLGNTSSKKKPKRTKSQSHIDEIHGSSSTIDNLVKINPVQPNRAWSSTYGSLPDAEFTSDNGLYSMRTSQTTTNKYPGLSAIVQHHLRPGPTPYHERPPIPTTTIATTTTKTPTPQRLRRFETSTTTLNENEQHEPRPHSATRDTSTSTAYLQRYDGYIRPISPQKATVSVDINVIHVDLDELRGLPSPSSNRPSRYDSPEPTGTYRSSTTIYTRERPRVGTGEIRTWSCQDINANDNHSDIYKNPYSFVQVDHAKERKKDYYEHQVVPPDRNENFNEYRYSPRAQEQECYGTQQEQTIDTSEQEMEEEERYEVSYVYDSRNQYTYEARKYYDESHSTKQSFNEIGSIKNLASSNPISRIQSPSTTEREKVYEPSIRSYALNEYAQETLLKGTPVENSGNIPHNCTLKRTNSYDGLGILISTDTETRLNHFIREVEPNSPGHIAGLRKNDRLISVNGVSVENVDFNNVLILIKEGLNNDNLQFSVVHEPDFI